MYCYLQSMSPELDLGTWGSRMLLELKAFSQAVMMLRPFCLPWEIPPPEAEPASNPNSGFRVQSKLSWTASCAPISRPLLTTAGLGRYLRHHTTLNLETFSAMGAGKTEAF